MDTDHLFQAMVQQQASDLFLKVGSRPCVRVRGQLQPIGAEPLSRADLLQLAHDLMGPERQQLFQRERELNFAFAIEAVGRFRANVLWQRGSLALVIRRIQDCLPTFEELNLPAAVLTRFTQARQGLVLVSGPTGSGKSTTVAAMLDAINRTQACHIVTLEDPIEFLFEERQAVINQREVGVDTKSFSEGLKSVLRQSPDVLFVSDLRDREAMEAALVAAESGQLVLSCIHTTNAMTTIERLVTSFPPHQQSVVRFRLSLVLKGIVSLRLLPRLTGQGQIPACEILVTTPRIRELIQTGAVDQIPPLLQDGALQGMQTLTQALYHLVRHGEVALDEARAIADKPEELDLMLREVRGIRDSHDAR